MQDLWFLGSQIGTMILLLSLSVLLLVMVIVVILSQPTSFWYACGLLPYMVLCLGLRCPVLRLKSGPSMNKALP